MEKVGARVGDEEEGGGSLSSVSVCSSCVVQSIVASFAIIRVRRPQRRPLLPLSHSPTTLHLANPSSAPPQSTEGSLSHLDEHAAVARRRRGGLLARQSRTSNVRGRPVLVPTQAHCTAPELPPECAVHLRPRLRRRARSGRPGEVEGGSEEGDNFGSVDPGCVLLPPCPL